MQRLRQLATILGTPAQLIASRVVAAILGGYIFASIVALLLARILPVPAADALMVALLMSFLLYALAVLWVFAARTASLAWLGLALPALLFGVTAWAIGR